MTWKPIDTAPMDGRPVWVRGWDWGKPDGSRHCCFAYWDGEKWREAASADSSILTHLTEWLPPTPTAATA